MVFEIKVYGKVSPTYDEHVRAKINYFELAFAKLNKPIVWSTSGIGKLHLLTPRYEDSLIILSWGLTPHFSFSVCTRETVILSAEASCASIQRSQLLSLSLFEHRGQGKTREHKKIGKTGVNPKGSDRIILRQGMNMSS